MTSDSFLSKYGEICKIFFELVVEFAGPWFCFCLEVVKFHLKKYTGQSPIPISKLLIFQSLYTLIWFGIFLNLVYLSQLVYVLNIIKLIPS